MDLSSWLSPIKAPVFISTSTLISLHFQLKVVMCLSVSLQVEFQNRSTNSTQFDIARLLILNRILGGKSEQQHVLERQQKGMVVSRKDKRLKKNHILLFAGEEPAAMQHGSNSGAVQVLASWSYCYVGALCAFLLSISTYCWRRDDR